MKSLSLSQLNLLAPLFVPVVELLAEQVAVMVEPVPVVVMSVHKDLFAASADNKEPLSLADMHNMDLLALHKVMDKLLDMDCKHP